MEQAGTLPQRGPVTPGGPFSAPGLDTKLHVRRFTVSMWQFAVVGTIIKKPHINNALEALSK